MRLHPSSDWTADALAVVGSVAWQLHTEGAADLPMSPTAIEAAFASAPGLIAFTRSHKSLDLVRRTAMELGIPSSKQQDLDRISAADTLRALRAAGYAVQVSQLLSDAHCQPLMVKGIALSVQTTGRLDARGVGDVDVLVAPEHVADAVAVMLSVGATPRPNARPQHLQARSHAVTLDWHGTSVDIHRRLAHSPTLTPPSHRTLVSRAVQVNLGGALVNTLNPLDAAVHIAVDSAHDSWSQLIRVADFARLLRLIGLDDTGVAGGVAESWGASRQWGLALAMLRRLRSDLPRQDP